MNAVIRTATSAAVRIRCTRTLQNRILYNFMRRRMFVLLSLVTLAIRSRIRSPLSSELTKNVLASAGS